MLRRLVVFGTALMMICGFAVTGIGFGGPTGAAAAGVYGVGPSQTGAAGQARACEATAANDGVSTATGLQCTSIVATFTANGDGTSTYTVTGTGLAPNSSITRCYSDNIGDTNLCRVLGTADASGNFVFTNISLCSAFPSDFIETDTFYGTAANGSAYTSPTYTLALSSVCP